MCTSGQTSQHCAYINRPAMKRRRSKAHSFADQISAERAKAEGEAAKLPPGPAKDAMLKKIRQLDTASHVNEWLSSPGLKSPD